MTDLEQIQQELEDCTRCKLHLQRDRLVFGTGSPAARAMMVGEAPGRNENRTGEPFVGDCGHLLDRLLERAGLSRAEVYLANVCKCWQPENRDPEPDEIMACSPFLHRQILAINPKVLVGVGRYAAQRLSLCYGSMDALLKMPDLHYSMPDGPNLPVIPIYHPSYLLRSGREKTPKSIELYRSTVAALARARDLAYQNPA